MTYSYKIEQAIRGAALLHDGQKRRGRAAYPYITHLMSVLCIAMDYTNDEATLIAALLHDTLEDTDYTREELRKDFGLEVERLVMGVTEYEKGTGEVKTWKEKKLQYIERLKNAEEGSLIIAAADKIHNLRSEIEEYYEHEERYKKDFPGNTTEKVLIYEEISNILNRKLQNGILGEFNHVFQEYKEFIANLEASDPSTR